MRSVADEMRARTAARVLAMPLSERIALAFALGDDDLTLYARASGLDLPTARNRLRAQRHNGRTPSACAVTPP
jgi:hypothetical protein